MDAGRPPALGLLGGAFDPVHHGHLRLAIECRERLGLGEVRLLPTGQAPHRPPALASGGERMAMLQLAVAGETGLACDDRELLRVGPSYTVNTLEQLRSENSARPLLWICGLDAFLGLPGWHRWQELLQLAHLVVVHRPGYGFDPATAPQLAELQARHQSEHAEELRSSAAGRLLFLSLPLLEISSTAIRSKLRAEHSIRYLLPEPVQAFINTHHLYTRTP